MLRLVWQDPSTRKFIEVGKLSELQNGSFAFAYTKGANSPGFLPLAEFPSKDVPYLSDSLPAFFQNRVMSPSRSSYRDYLQWLGFDDVPTPIEILARTGGTRATDTFHVVDSFAPLGGKRVGRFFASGVRHVDGAHDRLKSLHLGQELFLRDEPQNPANPLAILLDAASDEPVGYVPDWLVAEVHAMREDNDQIRISVEKVNADAPAHLRLLCLLEASTA
jgi:hypothetical protein